ncbi:MAG: hypothetical protein AAGG55_04850 [Pseudomonadota bacterium]
MGFHRFSSISVFLCALVLSLSAQGSEYSELTKLFADWRAFEAPPLLDGAPDYTAERFEASMTDYKALRARLDGMDIDAWPVEQKVDWHIVRAEMNGYDFNHRVLKPWVRDPAFYQTIWDYRSDVPAHEGPTHHAVLELWAYRFPLSAKEEARMIRELAVIPPLLAQAQKNLTGNARDLWIAGTRNIEDQLGFLSRIREASNPESSGELEGAIAAAEKATEALLGWLREMAPSKTGPSGVGRENYTWYQQQVHYLPLTFEEETFLLERELDRSWSSLALEEHSNRALPPLEAAATEAEYNALVDWTSKQMLAWFEDEDVLPMRDYMKVELTANLGPYEPPEVRNFFTIGTHYDPRPLLAHFYHWFDLAEIQEYPHASPIRRGPLLYNIFDSRNEGIATGVEEMFMHAGLYKDTPRAREIVWIMLAQRAARGLGSLDAHANIKTMAEAGTIHVEWTPRGWMSNEPELLAFEQHLYLRQPGYGTSYVTGKYLTEKLLATRKKQMAEAGKDYPLIEYFRELRDLGSIPISLVHWQLTGDDSAIVEIMNAATP